MYPFTRFIRFTVVATLCSGLFLMLTAPAALAHDRLKRSSPAKDAKVAAVEQIELEFTSRVRLPAVVLHDADGKTVAIGKPRAEGDLVTSAIATALPPGRYSIGWRVVSSDGHPIEGEIPFTVTAPATPTLTPTATATQPAPSTAEASSSPAAVSEPTNQGVPGWIWAGVAALVVIGVGVALLASRRNRSVTDD